MDAGQEGLRKVFDSQDVSIRAELATGQVAAQKVLSADSVAHLHDDSCGAGAAPEGTRRRGLEVDVCDQKLDHDHTAGEMMLCSRAGGI
jgi:hypothetical protein